MENKVEGTYLVLNTVVGIVGAIIGVISIIVTVISIHQTCKKDKHQKSNRAVEK